MIGSHSPGGRRTPGAPLAALVLWTALIVPASSPGQAPIDWDGDGTPDLIDNCPRVANPDQANSDPLLAGDLCQCGDLDSSFQAQLGGEVTVANLALDCSSGDPCTASTVFDLPAGTHYVEAFATYQTPGP